MDFAARVGSGDHAVLVLHGWFGSAAAWAPLWPHLDRARFSYYFMDYRGYGTRKHVEGVHSIEEAASDTVTMARELGIERFSVIGHSMGGSVMQQVALQAPDLVRALVGISPVPASGVPMDGDLWRLFDGAADSADNRRAIIDFSTGNRLSDVWLDATVQHSLHHSTRQAFADYLMAFARTDFHERVVGSQTPVLVLVGEHDPAMSMAVMRPTYGEWYRDVQLVELPNAGHYAMDELPVTLATEIEKFLVEH
ncbi:alpha/beta fold hydrolase [Kutzneria sp. CA-103260]|uniref:alpha/beta fold hydrolase n=1 Tax=Kutzneria sp. CA-103260 TaxID=2802641 RepID=UPI001BA6881F|nr:alpha/beta hydrolase [Kutzneria sp. CA-103260]